MKTEQIVKQAAQSGKFFAATFRKADGSMRRMLCRGGVKRYLKGGVNPHNAHPENVVVWDVQAKGYRTIPTTRLQSITFKGNTYHV
jgi:hypothetical protein